MTKRAGLTEKQFATWANQANCWEVPKEFSRIAEQLKADNEQPYHDGRNHIRALYYIFCRCARLARAKRRKP